MLIVAHLTEKNRTCEFSFLMSGIDDKTLGFFWGPGWLEIFPQQPFRKVIHVHHPTSGGKRIKNNSVYILGLYKKTRSCLGRFFLGGVQVDSSTQEHQTWSMSMLIVAHLTEKNRTCEFSFLMSGI